MTISLSNSSLLFLLIFSSSFASAQDSRAAREELINRGPASPSFSSHVCTGTDPKGGEYSYPCDSSGRPTGSSRALTTDDLIGKSPANVGNNSNTPQGSANSIDAISYISDCRATGASKSECEQYLRDAQPSTGESTNPEDILNRSYGYKEGSEEPGKGGAFATCGPGETKDSIGRCVPTANPSTQQQQAQQSSPQPNAQQQQPNPLMGPPASAAMPSVDIAVCTTAKDDADKECDPSSQSWMKAINQVSTLLGSQLNQGACSALAAAQAGSAASMSLYTTQCGKAVAACLNECRRSVTSSDASIQYTATEAVKACNAKGVTAKQAEQAAARGIQEVGQAVQSCRATFGMDLSLGSQAAYVGKSADDILAGLQQTDQGSLNHQGVEGALTGDMNSNLDLSDLVDDRPAGMAAKPRTNGQAPGGQQGSAGLGSAGGVGVDASSGKGNNNRRGSTGLLSNILSGFFGGGGGSFGGSGRSSGGGFSSWFGGGGGSSSSQASANAPDLRQFLPGAVHDPKKDRGIAGRIVSKDGISGPHGNVWRDISNRYQVKRASLLP